MNGWPTTQRFGVGGRLVELAWAARPEVLEPMIAFGFGGGADSLRAGRVFDGPRRSGALSWMKSASRTHSSMVATNFRRSCDAPGARPCFSNAGQALAMRLRKACSAPGAGSQATTSRPWARARATQPLPITPLPSAAKVLISVMKVMLSS
ncbi:hypothetical protein PPS11_10568 [Pseudomonas putida S11]|nr:hypothetical protein PPS11_10568 [Pseudomonas putida S11]